MSPSTSRIVAGAPVTGDVFACDLKPVSEAIADGTFSDGDTDRFKPLLNGILEGDYFMLAADFGDYLARQRDVGAAYRQKQRWFRSALLNTANVGWFSSDRSIRQYDREIWGSNPSLWPQD